MKNIGACPPAVLFSEKNFSQKKIAWIKLNLFNLIGPLRFRSLLEYFGDINNVFCASEKELANVENIGGKIAGQLAQRHSEVEKKLEKELKLIEKYQVKVVLLGEADYPANLVSISDPPYLLYVHGELKKEDQFSLGVVGTRYPSDYGCQAAKKLVKELVGYKLTIVSGLARGIDTVAHQTALINQGRTIAVLGNGLLYNYPRENKKLQEKIAGQGAVLSEFPLQSLPERGNFPRRNRIISGLSLGSLVIEGKENSGSLITARFALEQGREVFALPGNIFNPLTVGPHSLLKMGAKLVEKSADILEELAAFLPKTSAQKTKANFLPEPQLSLEEQLVYDSVEFDPLPIDCFLQKTNLSISQLLDNLLRLELKGLIKSLPGKMFVRNN
ncbi:MAG: DNA-processing protein DprA [Elusimicrobiota bacterium]